MTTLQTREPSAKYLATLPTPLVQHFELLATAPEGVARLRELILTLAVQGQLVPQDPNDEPASVLLQKIGAEKARLVAEGKIKRERPLAPITADEISFPVPPGWQWVRLAEVVNVLNGRAYSKQELLDVGRTPVLRVGNLFTSNHWYHSNLELEPEKYCAPGDLLYAWSASFGPFIWKGPKAIYHYHIWKLDPYSRPNFHTGYFHTYLLEKTAEIKAAGHGVSMTHMTKEKMERICVPYPPLAEQARIVARVEALMQLCDALEAQGRLEAEQHGQLVSTLLGTLLESTTPEALAAHWQRVATHFDLLLDRPEAVDALEQTVLFLGCTGRLGLPASEASVISSGSTVSSDGVSAEHLPRRWAWVPLGSLCELVTSGSRGWKTYYADEGATFIRSQDIKLDRLEFDQRAYVKLPASTEGARTLVRKNDILITITGANVGKAAVLDEVSDEAYVSQHVALVRLVQPAFSEFVHLWLVSEHGGRKRLLSSSYGAKPGLNLQNLKDLMVPMPPLDEQRRIVKHVRKLLDICDALRTSLAASRATQTELTNVLVAASHA